MISLDSELYRHYTIFSTSNFWSKYPESGDITVYSFGKEALDEIDVDIPLIFNFLRNYESNGEIKVIHTFMPLLWEEKKDILLKYWPEDF